MNRYREITREEAQYFLNSSASKWLVPTVSKEEQAIIEAAVELNTWAKQIQSVSCEWDEGYYAAIDNVHDVLFNVVEAYEKEQG